MSKYITKKARAARAAFLEKDFDNANLTQAEIKVRFPDLPENLIPEPNTVFTWNNCIIRVKFHHKPVFEHYNNLKHYHSNGNN